MKKIFTLIACLSLALGVDAWVVSGSGAILNGETWNHTSETNTMTKQADGTWQLVVENAVLEQGTTYEWLVTDGTNWIKDGSQNYKLTVNQTAKYKITYTLAANAQSATAAPVKTGEAGNITHTYSIAGTPAIVFGEEWSATNTVTDMTLGGDGLYSWKKEGIELPANTQIKFKVVVDHSWGEAYPASDVVKTISESGVYDLTFTFNPTTKAVNMASEKKGNSNIENVYVVTGSTAGTEAGSPDVLFGTAWDGTLEANKMEKQADGTYSKTYTNATLVAGTIKWKVVMNGTTWIPDGTGNDHTIFVPEDGTYDVIFNFNEETTTLSSKLMKDGQEIIVNPTGEGWPANYGGVMLQGFYWNSTDDTKWANLEAQANEICRYFDVVWVPNSASTGGEGMGYLPLYWLNHNSNFGRAKTLKSMINTFRSLGTKVIEDVVLNHKAPLGKNGSWVDFVNEKWTHDGITEQINWTTADICRNDDGGYTNTVGATEEMIEMNGGWECTGSNDTGDDFSGGRDLDHTSANVQQNCITYLKYLQKEIGYSGYRLDMVKGYSAYYTRMYNEATQPEFCVGEYWDGQDAITNWIAGTGYTSAAFDFPFKYQVKDAFGNGNWSALDYKGLCGDPSWQRYSVTFIDNHDTYENESRLVGNVLGANAFMLAMPGTPCVFLKHWQRYPIAIGNMILARKAAGITNQSSYEGYSTEGGYVLKVNGTNGIVVCLAGNPGFDLTNFTVIAKGSGFAYCVSNNVTVEGLREGNDDEEEKDITIYVEADEAPYIYAWNTSGDPINGTWPGTQMTTTDTAGDGKTFWTVSFTKVPVNIIINNGAAEGLVQSADIENLKHDSYFTFDPSETDKNLNWTDITSNYFTPEPVVLPACAKAKEGHIYCYFQGNKDYDSPCAWVWNEDKNFCATTNWPGDKLTRVGSDNDGHAVWIWDAGEAEEIEGVPEMILFSNNGSPQTENFKFVIGGYYDATGLVGNVNDTQGINNVMQNTQQHAVIYNLSGQRVSANYRGIVIENGQKRIAR